MSDPTAARDRAEVVERALKLQEGSVLAREVLRLRALAGAPTADVAATEWGAKWSDSGYCPSNPPRSEDFARQHARNFGTRPIRRAVGPWLYDDTGEFVFADERAQCTAAPEGVDAADERFPRVAGRCPSCHGTSLFLGAGGHVTCSRLDCRAPVAVDDQLHAEPDGMDLEAQGAMADELTAAQAAIQRVRARCDERESRREWLGEHADWVAIAEIRRALDGDTTEEKR